MAAKAFPTLSERLSPRMTQSVTKPEAAPAPTKRTPGDHAELEERIAQLEQRNLALERFAAMAAHQLAEPLVIAESSAILVAEQLGDDLDPMLRARLDAIGRGAARARRLMDALLEDARSSETPPNITAVDLAEVVEETLVSLEPQIEARHALVEVGDLPCVRGERRLLSVIIDNLVANALKHGPRDNGVITIGAQPYGDGWRLAIGSQGPPIPAADLPRIFAPFDRLPGERRVSGSGLGLAICLRLVERLGGTLGHTVGGANEGNVFWLLLPAERRQP
jgi:signal transduction histidine kinase